jgi:lipid II:glycine glycyltransferase (peptidoglycan interpeptide bridge formation enzyme)
MTLTLHPVPYRQVQGGDNLFQTRFWGRFKSSFGWTPRGFRYNAPSGSGSLLVLDREIGSGRRMAYVPHGPDLEMPSSQHGRFLEALSYRLRRELPQDCVFIRFDLPWPTPYAEALDSRTPASEDPRPVPRVRELRMNFATSEWNLRKAPTDLLPPDTVVVDLDKGDDRILAGMSSTARYNVRMSGRRGVTVQNGAPEELPVWQRLYADTTRRHGLENHPRSYFRRLFEARRSDSRAETGLQLLFARVGESVAAAMILALSGRQALYLFGASDPRFNRLAPSHRLQWQAMQLAKRQGCTKYDLFGIPPSSNASHPAHGLLRFKTGFGGTILRRRGCWDFPFDPRLYEQLRGAELGRERFHRSV